MDGSWRKYRRTCKGGLYDFEDGDHRMVIPCKWEKVRHFREGLAAVKREGKWGFINTDGQLVIPCQWDWAYDFLSGDHTALVCRITGHCDAPPFDGDTDFCQKTGKLCTGILSCDQIETFRIMKTGDRLWGDYPLCRSCGEKMTEFDGGSLYTCPGCGKKVKLKDNWPIWDDAPEFSQNNPIWKRESPAAITK